MSTEAYAIMERLQPFTDFSEEVQLLDFGETAGGGPYLKFRLADPDQLDPFRGKTRQAKNTVGQRYACLLIPINDDESAGRQEPTPSTAPVTTAVLAFRACRNVDFQRQAQIQGGYPATEAGAAAFIKSRCGVISRKDLDVSRDAQSLFRSTILPIIRECSPEAGPE